MDVLVVSRENADKKAQWISGVISGIEKGRIYLFDSATKDEANQIVADHLGVSKEEVETELGTVKLYKPSEAKTALSEGGLAYKAVSTICDFYKKTGSISKDIPPKNVMNTSFDEAVKE